MDITGNDLFDRNVGMACANIRLRFLWISLVLIYLIKLWVRDRSANVRLRCSWILLVLIYLIKISVWHVPMLDSGVYGYH